MAEHTPSIDFSTFILSLASTAMINLGRMPDPTGGSPEIDLGLARQNIDLLIMLRDKTDGNLSTEENTLITKLLYDLRIAFVDERDRRHP